MADKMSIDKGPSITPNHAGNAASHYHRSSLDRPNHLHTQSQNSLDEHSDDDIESPSEKEQGLGPGLTGSHAGEGMPQPKRKGGRKPIYATSEERKQRNRQAQAAFRERRTEYIKQLEETIRVHESNLHNLQTAHRNAADECLMLRYKNSLLERILLEKGIDVQAELRAKTGSPNLGPTHVPQNMVQPPPIQRAIMNRHHQSRRSNSNIAPKSDAGLSAVSPKNRMTPSSQHSNSPNNNGASAFSPAASDSLSARGGSGVGVQKNNHVPMSHPGRQNAMQPIATRTGPMNNSSSYYPTPAFQNHHEQLDTEYDGQHDMVEDSEIETPSASGPYPGGVHQDGHQSSMLSPAASNGTGQHQQGRGRKDQAVSASAPYPTMTQLLDQNLDWDPFGLSASMAFPPQQFPFDQQSSMR